VSSDDRLSADQPRRVESPFLSEELFAVACEVPWQPHAATLIASPFQRALDGARDLWESSNEEQFFDALESPGLTLSAEAEEDFARAGDREDDGEVSGAPPLEERFDPSTIPQDVADALAKPDWPLALQLAIQGGWHDENELTNLIFFTRHKELEPGPLDKNDSKFKKLSDEWGKILKTEVRPVIQKASEDTNLKVTGVYVAERDPQLSGEAGRKFKELVESVAADAGLDPGFLAAVLLAEWDRHSLYLSTGEVKSFVTGTDDFFASRAQLRANVPAFSKVRFDESRKTTNVNEHGRTVTTIPFKTGRDAALATAVYLKYAEIKLRKAFEKNGADFDALPAETRFALVRIAMAAGHGGISQDGDLIRFKKKDDKWVALKKGESGGTLFGVASRVQRVLNGEDILVRKYEPRKNPTDSGHVTNRNATILAAQAKHLSDWFFGVPSNAAAQPELEMFEGFDDAELLGSEGNEDAEASYSDFDPELTEAADDTDHEMEEPEPSFERLVPKVSLVDLRTRIDDYLNLARATYTLPGGTVVSALPQFRYAGAGGTEAAITRVSGILGSTFEKTHPRAIRNAAYGRARPSEIEAITQALIDAGKFAAVRNAHPSLSNGDLVRALQEEFKMGIDCAGYVQLAFIYAFTGSDNDTPSLRRDLGLHEKRGWEKLSDLSSSAHFKKVDLVDGRTGDLFVLRPPAGSREPGHTVIVVDRTVSGTVHTFLVDASWGTGMYGKPSGGVARRKFKYDTSSGEWWDINPASGNPEPKNTAGPYNGHLIDGMYRAKEK